ncbi:hypothetical protein DPEC_G00328420 [Dallia pectoralis]|uniref:Uncharacterized protein n=1 Tax=Dallia pectoralis TaxID=75939 RepID=A0ACC2F8E9_DALPE|nr:hypothetical protein DPEC_G00328420 [Dallia pectoralis]
MLPWTNEEERESIPLWTSESATGSTSPEGIGTPRRRPPPRKAIHARQLKPGGSSVGPTIKMVTGCQSRQSIDLSYLGVSRAHVTERYLHAFPAWQQVRTLTGLMCLSSLHTDKRPERPGPAGEGDGWVGGVSPVSWNEEMGHREDLWWMMKVHHYMYDGRDDVM